MKTVKFFAVSIIITLCAVITSCGDDDDTTNVGNEGGNGSITGTVAKVDVKKAGSLSTLISDDVKFNITDLTVTGDINGDDIALIREMAGADVNGDETKGHLSILNLKDANIVAGGNPYYVKSTTEACYSKKNIIGSYMFTNCKLTNVILPSNATEIGSNIFYKTGIEGYSVDNTTLVSIIIGDKVTVIDDSAFSRCIGLTEIIIPNGVTKIGESAFSECVNLAKISISDNVTSIGEGAFSGCNINEFIVSEKNNSYSSLDGVLFNKDKTQLLIYPIAKSSSSYVIPNSVKTIKKNVFSNCKLTSITIGDNITDITDSGFNNYLAEYIVSEKNEYYSSLDGLLLNKDKTKLIAYPKSKTNSSYTIPNSITKIENNVFNGCLNLTTLNINNVTWIGTAAFTSSYIRNFIVPDSNTGFSAINGVLFNKAHTALVAYPMALMKDYAPNGKGSNYVIPNGVESVYSYAFIPISEMVTVDGDIRLKVYPLETLTIPASVQSIGHNALYGVLNIHCKGEIPPSFDYSSYYPIPLTGRNVYVPIDAVDTYKQARGWREANIIGE